MNILIIVRDFCSGKTIEKNGMPSKSGAEIHVERHANEFVCQGHKVTIMAKQRLWSKPMFEKISDGIQLFRLPRIARTFFASLWILANQRKIDVMYIFGLNPFSMAGIVLAKFLNIPTVFVSTMTGEAFESVKQDKFYPASWKPHRRMRDMVLNICTVYLAISQEIADEMLQHGLKSGKIVRMPQGVSTSHFFPLTDEQKECLKSSLQLPLEKVIVLFCSRLDHRKGFDILINTWPKIAAKNPNLHLLVVGGGPQDQIDTLNKLNMNVSSATMTYIGEVQEPLKYYQCSDIFIFPSRREGLPNVLMEAMASGCACVSSDIGGCRDIIIQNETGVLFQSENENQFVESICKLASEQNEILRLRNNAIEFCHKTLDIKVIGSKLVDLFYQIKSKSI